MDPTDEIFEARGGSAPTSTSQSLTFESEADLLAYAANLQAKKAREESQSAQAPHQPLLERRSPAISKPLVVNVNELSQALFNITPTTTSAVNAGVILTDESINTMDASTLLEIDSAIAKGTKTRLRSIDTTDPSKAIDFKHVCNLLDWITQVQDKFRVYGLLATMKVLHFDVSGTVIDYNSPDGTPTDILQNLCADVSLARVYKTAVILSKGASENFLKRLEWSKKLLLGSCDSILVAKANREIEQLKPSVTASAEDQNDYAFAKLSGHLPFYFICKAVTTTEPSALSTMAQNLRHLDITNFDGQNIDEVVYTIQAVLFYLANAKSTPTDLEPLLWKIFRTCTVPPFLSYLDSIKSNIDLGHHQIITAQTALTPEHLLSILREKYKDLFREGVWIKTHRTGSAFNTTPKSDPASVCNSWKPPKQGESLTRTVNGETYVFCGKCNRNKGKWRHTSDRSAHTTPEHKGNGHRNKQKQNSSAPDPHPDQDKGPGNRTVRFANHLSRSHDFSL